MNPKVLIIVPVYNVENYIHRFMNSVLEQTFSSWQMVLVDDGSSDDSGLICDEYAQKYNNIHVIHQKNQGVSGARNAGLDSGIDAEYVAFLDPDDWIEPEMLGKMIEYGDGSDIIVCDAYDYYRYDNDEQIKTRNTWKDHSEWFVADKYYDIICKSINMWNKLIKRSLIGNHRFDLGITYGENEVFMVEIIPLAKNVVIIPKPFYYYYKNRPGNVVSSGLNKKTTEFLSNSIIVYKELAKQNMPTCGVFRVYSTVIEVFGKIDLSSKKTNRNYISACGTTLRKTKIVDRIRYLFDPHFRLSMRSKLLFLFLCYFPCTAFSIMKRRGLA